MLADYSFERIRAKLSSIYYRIESKRFSRTRPALVPRAKWCRYRMRRKDHDNITVAGGLMMPLINWLQCNASAYWTIIGIGKNKCDAVRMESIWTDESILRFDYDHHWLNSIQLQVHTALSVETDSEALCGDHWRSGSIVGFDQRS